MGDRDIFTHTKTLLTQQFPDEHTNTHAHTHRLQIDIGLCADDASTFPLTPSYHRRHYIPSNTLEKVRPDYSWVLSNDLCTHICCHRDGISHSHVWDERSRFMVGSSCAQWCSVCHHADFQ